MFQKDKWPFTPNNLNEIIDEETLAVIEAGCRERLGRNMTIIDHGINGKIPKKRTDPINHGEWHRSFCHLLRNRHRVEGGNEACENCDFRMVREFIKQKKKTNDFKCHMNLEDIAQQLCFQGQHIATILSGQFAPSCENDRQQIKNNVHILEHDQHKSIRFLDRNVNRDLIKYVDELETKPHDFAERLEQEAEHIEKIVDAEFQRQKTVWQQEFLDTLRAFDQFVDVNNLQQLHRSTQRLLTAIKNFCRCDYVIFYANVQENETVLTTISDVGLPSHIHSNLPHFNWRKSGLPMANTGLHHWQIETFDKVAKSGIRGDNTIFFENIGCLVPNTIGESYRGVLLFGPFEERVNLVNEKDFLGEISRIIGWFVLVKLQQHSLKEEREHRKSTENLLIHQIRTAITPVTTQIKTAIMLLRKPATRPLTKLIQESLEGAHILSLQLGQSAGKTVKSHVLQLEREDMKFQLYSLSVLVANCGETYKTQAEKKRRYLIVEESIERLLKAEIDIARLTIALSNLLDNAVKYSFVNTTIYIRAISPAFGDLDHVTIEVENLGREIPIEEREKIFNQGRRGLLMARTKIPGTGLGLWETQAVVEAHDGTVECICEPTRIQRNEGRAYKIIFRVRLPQKQNDTR